MQFYETYDASFMRSILIYHEVIFKNMYFCTFFIICFGGCKTFYTFEKRYIETYILSSNS